MRSSTHTLLFSAELSKNQDFLPLQILKSPMAKGNAIKSKLKPFAYLLYPLVKLGLGVFVKQIVEELKYFAENGTPIHANSKPWEN